MRSNFKRIITLIFAICLMLSVASCGGESANTGSSSSSDPVNAGSDNSSISSVNGENISSKDTIVRVLAFAEPGSYNGWKAGATQAASPILDEILEAPLRMTEDGIEYILFESYEVDGTTFTAHLRENVYFHNGEKMTAEDVVYSVELQRESASGASGLKMLDTMEIIDENTVQFNLKYTSSNFVVSLSNCKITSKAYFEEAGHDGFALHPIGTGYFMWDQYVSGDTVILKAFDKYYGTHGTINTLQFRFITETSQSLIEMENGNVDIFVADGSTLTSVGGNDAIKSCHAADNILEYCGFNFNSDKVQNIRVRQALCYAIDREAIIAGAREGQGSAAYGCVSNAQGEKYNAEVESYYKYDPEKAAELMAEAGYTKDNPLTLKLMTDTQTQRSLEAQQIKNMLDQVGFNIEIQLFEAAAFNDILMGGDPEWYDLVIRGMGSTLGEPLAQIQTLLSPDATLTKTNPMHLSEDSHEKAKEFNDKVNEALQIMDPEKQLPLVLEIQEIEREIIPCCWLFGRDTYYVMNAKLMGMNQTGPNILAKDAYWVE